jgi:hypothetical protein
MGLLTEATFTKLRGVRVVVEVVMGACGVHQRDDRGLPAIGLFHGWGTRPILE